MKRLGLLAFVVLLVACQSDQTGPGGNPLRVPSAMRADEGPPSQFPFGADTYRVSGPFAGAPSPPLVCQAGTSTGATYDGYLASEADQTSLDARLQIPVGDGPFPLVALIHGYAGSKSSSGDIASKLLADGYAVLRYSTRGFGESWGQVNLADLNLEIADLRSMIGRVMDDPNCNLDPEKVAVTGASYGGGHSWLALMQPTFPTPSGTKTVHIVAVAPIAPWTDLFYSLLPNGRPNASIEGFGGLKLSFVNGLYASGIREDPSRPYPNYPDYFTVWHGWINTTEPSAIDPLWLQIRDGVAGYRSIFWQQAFWNSAVHNRVPVFQVQGFTDDLFPLPEAKRMLLALDDVEPNYPITSYFGDIGHPRASNKTDEVDYVLSLIRPWLAAYLKAGTAPTPRIYAALTRPHGECTEPRDSEHELRDLSREGKATFRRGRSHDRRAANCNSRCVCHGTPGATERSVDRRIRRRRLFNHTRHVHHRCRYQRRYPPPGNSHSNLRQLLARAGGTQDSTRDIQRRQSVFDAEPRAVDDGDFQGQTRRSDPIGSRAGDDRVRMTFHGFQRTCRVELGLLVQ